jgi:enoyl-CoA hydratase/carnithine racemase
MSSTEIGSALWRVKRSDGVVVARFGDPPMSYLTGPALGELEELVAAWADPEVRAVVIAGSVPGRFITHFSVEEILAGQPTMAERGPELNYRVHALFGALADLGKPVIGAMNGDTMGAGLELALSCDIRIGEHGDYRYGLPEVRLGLIPGGTGTQRLARLVGRGQALEMILGARLLTPEEALARGVVGSLADDALAAAEDLAAELAALPPAAMAAAKRVIHQASDLPLAAALRMEADASFRAKVSPQATAAMERYVALDPAARRDYLDRGRLNDQSFV